MVLELVSLILGITVKLFGVYFVAVAVFGILKPREHTRVAPRKRFAVVVAARNEAPVIGRLVDSLREQDYPDALYDIFVVPNNCSDDTAEVARAHGAQVLTCIHPVSCKGDVLRQTLSWLLQDEKYDAFCVFDADNVVDRRYLAEMNNAFCAGARVAKGKSEALNPYESWVSGCYAIYHGMFSLFYNRARANCGLSAKLVGTGFAVSRETLLGTGGWNTSTIAEDAEYGAALALKGERVTWVPGAIAWDEQPLRLDTSFTLRRRWVSGIMDVGARMLPKLLGSPAGERAMLRVDFIVFLLTPFVQALAVLPLALNLGLYAASATLPGFAAYILAIAASGYLGATLLAAAIVGLHGGWDRRILKSVLMYGIFMLTWIPVAVSSLVRRQRSWKVISHGHSQALPEKAV